MAPLGMSWLNSMFGKNNSSSSVNTSAPTIQIEEPQVANISSTMSPITKEAMEQQPFAAPVDRIVKCCANDSTTRSAALKNVFVLSDFNLHRTLGTGSFGRVLLAQHKQNGQFYAIKKLRKTDIVRLSQVEHTNDERSLLAQVSHPFLVRLVSTYQDQQSLYLMMEYVGGGELFSLLRKVRVFPPFVAQFYAAEVILALEYLHARNIVYRDLKPENILLNADGHICITDFGFAKIVQDATWTVCGTPDYMAPEIVLSLGYSAAVDVYAVGILIYEMLLGAPPFYDESPQQIVKNIANKQPAFPQGFDPIARHLIEGLLEKNPQRRLGAMSGGISVLKSHPWFKSVQWDLLAVKRIRAPFRPTIAYAGDASNFDEYPEEDSVKLGGVMDTVDHSSLFPDF